MTSQIQLEQIRAQETEVRWQHEEDVDECPRCKRAFPHGTSKRKVSQRDVTCRHRRRLAFSMSSERFHDVYMYVRNVTLTLKVYTYMYVM